MGTSLTARATWPALLRDALADALHRPVEMEVVARPGATTNWMVEASRQSRAIAPTLVLLEGATNDAALHRGLTLSQSRANIRQILRRLAAATDPAHILVMAMNPAFGLRGLIRHRLDHFSDMHLAEAIDAGARAVDCRPLWRAMPRTERRRAIPDGLHPRAEAAGALVTPALLQIIAAEWKNI
ncbi:MAG: SGNH/GDSL hydrolase family protein [Sphingobium sp.]